MQEATVSWTSCQKQLQSSGFGAFSNQNKIKKTINIFDFFADIHLSSTKLVVPIEENLICLLECKQKVELQVLQTAISYIKAFLSYCKSRTGHRLTPGGWSCLIRGEELWTSIGSSAGRYRHLQVEKPPTNYSSSQRCCRLRSRLVGMIMAIMDREDSSLGQREVLLVCPGQSRAALRSCVCHCVSIRSSVHHVLFHLNFRFKAQS